jgi:hypothetical protein
VLQEVRTQGWALRDEQLASGIQSVATPLRDGSGTVIAAVNVTVHAAETSWEMLRHEHLPMLLDTAGRISADFALRDSLPHTVAGTARDHSLRLVRTIVRITDKRRLMTHKPARHMPPLGLLAAGFSRLLAVLASRAVSASEYALSELLRSLERPTRREFLERLETEDSVEIPGGAASWVRAERDNR